VERVPTDRVIILPNNKNIILAAQAVRELSDKQVLVVPTRTVPQGICALLALDQKGDIAAAAEAMESACDTIASGEITVATRSVVLDGIEVAEGQTIGLVNDRLCVANADLEAVLTQVLAEMEVGDREIISLYYGEDVTAEDAEALVKIIREQYPDVEVEVLPGGQAIYHYILGAE
jgi:dihydroxyacetone kinase-like predicted kinase